MVSKYEAQGLVVVEGREVDVEASLAALEGRLDEAKRQRALATWAELSGRPAVPAAHGVRGGDAPPARSAKVEKDEIEVQLRRLEYGQKAGELVAVEDVADRAREAVAAFREILANTRRETADRLCAEFNIPASKAAMLAKFLARRDDEGLGRFSAAMALLARADLAGGIDTGDLAAVEAKAV